MRRNKQKEISEKTSTILEEIRDILTHCNAYERVLPGENIQAREVVSVLKEKILNIGSEVRDLLGFVDVVDVKNPLTEREKQILSLVAKGMFNKEIAYKLNISDKTVQFHLKSIFNKLEVNSRTEASTKAIQNGLITI